jgi:hypothetical protein
MQKIQPRRNEYFPWTEFIDKARDKKNILFGIGEVNK